MKLETLYLTLPKDTYLFDFLFEKDMRAKLDNSWVFINMRIIEKLQREYGFISGEAMNSMHYFRREIKYYEEIIIADRGLPFKGWSALTCIMDNKNANMDRWYDADHIKPKYFIWLDWKNKIRDNISVNNE